MSLTDLLNQSQDGQGLRNLGQQFGFDEKTTQALASELAPTIASGAKRKAQAEGGLGTLLGQLKGESEVTYFQEPAKAAAPEARAKGEQFLESLFGSAEAPREIAGAAAARTGAPQDMVAQFLPALAAMLQGGLQSRAPDDQIQSAMGSLDSVDKAGSGIGDLLGVLGGSGGTSGGGLGSMIGGLLGGGGQTPGGAGGGLDSILQMLDADGDGSPFDDIVKKFTG